MSIYPAAILLLTACAPKTLDARDDPDPTDSAPAGDGSGGDGSGGDSHAGDTAPTGDGNGLPPEVAAYASDLPLILVNTRGVDVDADGIWDDDGARGWAAVDAIVVDVGGDGEATLGGVPDYLGQGGLHLRGNSSAGYDKKQYAFETWDDSGADQDVSLLGLPAEEDWVLAGPFSDKSLMRNHLMFTWSRRIGRYAPRTRFVEFFLVDDGEPPSLEHYRGVYVLTEKIKRDDDRVDVANLGPDDEAEPAISGGYLLKKDWYERDERHTYLTTATYQDVLLFVDPDPDAITDLQRDWITDWLNAFEVALEGPGFAAPDTGYAGWIDPGSFIDHHLLVEMARNVDGYVLSTYLHKDREGLLNMGPIWDYNGSLGNADYFDAYEIEGWHYENREFPADNPTAYRWYERLFEDPAFRAAYAARWAALRAEHLSNDALIADIDATAAEITAAAARNFERWDVLGEYVWPNAPGYEDRDSFEAEVAYLKEWVTARAAWMDGAVNTRPQVLLTARSATPSGCSPDPSGPRGRPSSRPGRRRSSGTCR